MAKRKIHTALWNDDTLELPATIAVHKPDLTVPKVSQLLRIESEKLDKKAKSTGITATESQAKYEQQRQELSDLQNFQFRQQQTLSELKLRVETVESDIETRSTNLIDKQSTIEAQLIEAKTEWKEWEDIKEKATLKEIETEQKEQDEENAKLAYSRSRILREVHRDIGVAFTEAMTAYFDYESGESNVSVNYTIEAILYIFFDLPFFFSKVELETFLGYAPDNEQVTGALSKMVENDMIVEQVESNGTIQYYYLGVIANQILQRDVMPVIGNISTIYNESITIRKMKGQKEIEKQTSTTSKEKSASNDENDREDSKQHGE